MILSNSTSPILEIGSGDRQIDYRKIHSPARPNTDDGRVAIRVVVVATGALRPRRSIARAIFGHQRGVIDEPDNERVFNGNAGFPRLSFCLVQFMKRTQGRRLMYGRAHNRWSSRCPHVL